MFEIVNFILNILIFVALVFYAYFAYLIARETWEPLASFHFKQYLNSSHLSFHLRNNSKVEIEVWGKIFAKSKDLIFESKGGFYGNSHPVILQPFTDFQGHIELKDLVNKNEVNLREFVDNGEVDSVNIIFQIRYLKVGSKKWKKSSVYKYFFDFNKSLFYLDV